jgi:hypothetical protein
MARTWIAPVATILIASLLVPACSSGKRRHGSTPTGSGSSSPGGTIDAKDLVERVFAAVGATRSFHVVGTGKDGNVAYSLDVHFSGGGGAGYFTQGSARFEVAGNGTDTYVKTAAANWEATIGKKPNAPALAQQLAPRWVRVPTDTQAFAQVLDYVNRDHFVTSYRESAVSGSGPFAKDGAATIDGVAATIYVDTKDNSRIYIAAQGAPLLLKVDSSAADGGGGLTITDYDKPFSPALPPAADIVDYTSVVK